MSALQQRLTLFDLTMIAVGSTIGSGIFLTPSLIAGSLGTPWTIMLVWIIGGLMALSGALTFAELGGSMPGAGGMYIYLKNAYGGLAGFLFGWAYFLVVNTGGIAALSVAFATYFGVFVPLSPIGLKIVAVAGIIVVTAINVRGVKTGGIFSDVFTILKLVGIVGLVLVGFLFGSVHRTDFTFSLFSDGFNSSMLAAAMVGVLWSYGGWQHATFASAEVINAKRTVPVSIILGATIVTGIYLLANGAYMFLLTPAEMADSSHVAADAVSTVLGSTGAAIIAAAIFISTFGTAGIYTLTAPRIYYAMSADGVFFRKLGEVHSRFATPANAIILQSLWASMLVLFWGTFENLISYVVFTDWIFFGLTAASIFVFRRKIPPGERPYSTLGYPITPIIFVGMAAWFVFNTLIEKPEQACAGLGFLAIGVPVYWYWKRKLK
jgi:APA family basic amino acid/polyamine antiporter